MKSSLLSTVTVNKPLPSFVVPALAAIKAFSIGVVTMFFVVGLLVVQASGQDKKLQVVASIFPAYDFARQVGGEGVELTQLLPPGVEAHGFSPTPRDIIDINHADVFLYTGSTMEPRVEKLVRSLDDSVLVVDLSSGIMAPEGGHHDDHNDHDHHGIDPHFWLNPLQAKMMVTAITKAFVKADPDAARGYRLRAATLLEQLDHLDQSIRTGLAQCSKRTIISGGHFAFGHFTKAYDLQAISAYPGFSGDGKPSPKSIARLIQTIKQTGATAVYHEELLDPKVARIIVEETGADLLLLHGAHNVSRADMTSGVSYLAIMNGNLKRLRQGLGCQ